MFSGIVETIGKIVSFNNVMGCLHFSVQPKLPFDDLHIGDSVAINGVCLTITAFTGAAFHLTAVPETLRLTNLNHLALHQIVNVERSVKLNSRLGGHYVQGHVDGTGYILELAADDSAALLAKISIPNSLAKYIAAKGYIALDGMSITVIEAKDDWFTVTFIPHTQTATIVANYQVGDPINIEVDMMAKYIEKMIGAYSHANIS